MQIQLFLYYNNKIQNFCADKSTGDPEFVTNKQGDNFLHSTIENLYSSD